MAAKGRILQRRAAFAVSCKKSCARAIPAREQRCCRAIAAMRSSNVKRTTAPAALGTRIRAQSQQRDAGGAVARSGG